MQSKSNIWKSLSICWSYIRWTSTCHPEKQVEQECLSVWIRQWFESSKFQTTNPPWTLTNYIVWEPVALTMSYCCSTQTGAHGRGWQLRWWSVTIGAYSIVNINCKSYKPEPVNLNAEHLKRLCKAWHPATNNWSIEVNNWVQDWLRQARIDCFGPLETGFYTHTHTKPLMGCASFFCLSVPLQFWPLLFC